MQRAVSDAERKELIDEVEAARAAEVGAEASLAAAMETGDVDTIRRDARALTKARTIADSAEQLMDRLKVSDRSKAAVKVLSSIAGKTSVSPALEAQVPVLFCSFSRPPSPFILC